MSFFKADDTLDKDTAVKAELGGTPNVSSFGDTFAASLNTQFNSTYLGKAVIEKAAFTNYADKITDGNDYSNLLDLYRKNLTGKITDAESAEYVNKSAAWDSQSEKLGIPTIDMIADHINKEYKSAYDKQVFTEQTSKGLTAWSGGILGSIVGDPVMLAANIVAPVGILSRGAKVAALTGGAIGAALSGVTVALNRQASEAEAQATGKTLGTFGEELAIGTAFGAGIGAVAGGLAGVLRARFASLPKDAPINQDTAKQIINIQELKDKGVKLTPEQDQVLVEAIDLANEVVDTPKWGHQAQHLELIDKASKELFATDESVRYVQNDRALQVAKRITGQNRELTAEELTKITKQDLASYNSAEQRDFEGNLHRFIGQDTGNLMGTGATTLPKELDTPEMNKFFNSPDELNDAEFARATKTLEDYRNSIDKGITTKTEGPISDLASFMSRASTDTNTMVDVARADGTVRAVPLAKAVKQMDREHKLALDLQQCLLNFGGNVDVTK